MTTTAWTPGPWYFYELGCDGDGLGYIRTNADAAEIAHHGDTRRTADENRANARLISAAPDLAEAADLILASMNGEAGYEFVLQHRLADYRRGMGALRAALAKARGQ